MRRREHQKRALRLLDADHDLTEWEEKFLESLFTWDSEPTAAQAEKLVEIEERYER